MPQYVNDWMNKNLIIIQADCLLSNAIQLLSDHNQQFLLYIHPDDTVFMLSNKDIKSYLPQQETLTVLEIMKPVPAFLQPQWTLEQALAEMQKQDVDFLPVKDSSHQLVGVFSIEAFFIAVREIKWKADFSD